MRKDILQSIQKVSNTLKWNDIEHFCKERDFAINPCKKGYKVSIGKTIWTVHLEHRVSDELKFGIVRQLKRILIKENILCNNNNAAAN